MKARALLFLFALLPSIALAQGYRPGGCNSANATCKGATLTLSGQATAAGFTATSAGFTAGTAIGINASGANLLVQAQTGGNIIIESGQSGADFAVVNSTGITTDTVHNPVPVVHQAQTGSPVAMEFGSGAGVSGALAVTFSTAFASAPKCQCTGVNATPAACSITVAPSTTTVTFKFNAGTDPIHWFCIGAK